jgi:hypothetical protein
MDTQSSVEKRMPPYRPYASKAQQRLLHAKAEQGEISKSEVEGKDKATSFAHLPERVIKKKSGTAKKRVRRSK